MAVVTFVAHDGGKHEAGLVEGRSLMQIATDNAVPGIDGDCGGETACGTCKTVRGPINPDGWCKQWTKTKG